MIEMKPPESLPARRMEPASLSRAARLLRVVI
jgi:hypothetical protein